MEATTRDTCTRQDGTRSNTFVHTCPGRLHMSDEKRAIGDILRGKRGDAPTAMALEPPTPATAAAAADITPASAADAITLDAVDLDPARRLLFGGAPPAAPTHRPDPPPLYLRSWIRLIMVYPHALPARRTPQGRRSERPAKRGLVSS